MRRLQIKFPSQIRISGWDFGSSARAMNQAGGKDALMTYLRVIFTQAESGKCPGSTFERKTMSSTIKRVALVAVAALGLGTLTGVSANAAAPAASTDTGAIAVTVAASNAGTAYSAPTATQVAGANNYVAFTIYAPAAPLAVAVTGGTAATTDANTTGSGTANLLTSKTSAGNVTYTVPTPTVGTITVKTYEFTSGAQSATATSSLTITVNAAAAGTVYNHSSVYINTSTGSDATADSTTLTDVATAADTKRAIITVQQYSSVDTATVMTTAASTAVTVSVSGAGLVGQTDATRGPSSTVAAGSSTNGKANFYLYSDGRSGTATITVTVNGAVASTKTFVFTSTTVSSYKAQSDSTAGNVLKKIIAVGASSSQDILGYDSNGNKVAGGAGTIYAVSADTSIATVSVSGTTISVTGVKSGSTNVTVCDTAACASAVKTLVIPVKVAKSTAASFTATFDQSSYAPGDAMTITLTAKDSDGNLVADGTYTLITSASFKYSKAFQSSSAVDALAGAISVKNGVATATAYAPATEGALNITYTDAIAAADVTVSTSVSSDTGSAAAIDAANEATDAANAATDAANAAAEAADAATAAAQDAQAAVAALATQVASLIAGIKAQITTLTNLVIKIQKKVKA